MATSAQGTSKMLISSDEARLNKIIMELGAKHVRPDLGVESSARFLIMDYVDELTTAIIEESALLATHRHSKDIDANDISLILAKNFNIEMPGGPLHLKSLYKHAFRDKEKEKERKDDGSMMVGSSSSVVSTGDAPTKKQGTKRKASMNADVISAEVFTAVASPEGI